MFNTDYKGIFPKCSLQRRLLTLQETVNVGFSSTIKCGLHNYMCESDREFFSLQLQRYLTLKVYRNLVLFLFSQHTCQGTIPKSRSKFRKQDFHFLHTCVLLCADRLLNISSRFDQMVTDAAAFLVSFSMHSVNKQQSAILHKCPALKQQFQFSLLCRLLYFCTCAHGKAGEREIQGMAKYLIQFNNESTRGLYLCYAILFHWKALE